MAAAAPRYGEINIAECVGRRAKIIITDIHRYPIRALLFRGTDYQTLESKLFAKVIDNHGQTYGPFLMSATPFDSIPEEGTGKYDTNATYECVPSTTAYLTPLSDKAIDYMRAHGQGVNPDIVSDKLEKTLTLVQELIELNKEKDARIAALEARVKELELIVSSPKPIATSDTTLLDLDDFFSTSSDDDIGNLPEFIHESS